MAKKRILGFLLIVLLTWTITSFAEFNPTRLTDAELSSVPLFGDDIYASNRYSQPENPLIFDYSSDIPQSFDLVQKDGFLELHYDDENHDVIVADTRSNYLWYSYARDTENESLNDTMKALMRSILVIEYFPYQERTEQLSTSMKRASMRDAVVSSRHIVGGVLLDVDFESIDIKIGLSITLEDGTLMARIDQDEIHEEENKIASISVLPNFGATRNDDIPGYIIIPDGPGALYRFKDNTGTQAVEFISRYYGSDRGISQIVNANPLTNLSMPVFGMVHGIDQHAFIGIIEQGATSADFKMSPSGANGIPYNTTTARFVMRESYISPINLKGDGIQSVQKERHDEQIALRYRFESGEKANYIGLAYGYRDNLVDQGALSKQTSFSPTMRLEVFQADSEDGLFGRKDVIMTTISETKEIVDRLDDLGVDIDLVLRGWNDSGFSGMAPYQIDAYERKLGRDRAFEAFFEETMDMGIDTYLYSDYGKLYEDARRINLRTDAARGLFRRQITVVHEDNVYQTRYYARPKTTKSLLLVDQKKADRFGFAMDTIGYELFSTFEDDQWRSRYSSLLDYQSALDSNTHAFYRPNAYIWPYMNAYFDTPLYHSQFTFYDDTIPFLQYALRGHVDLYSPLMNFFANRDEQHLMLIDYGIHPSYIVTKEATHELKYTDANQYFSTKYTDWEEEILNSYDVIEGALQEVTGSNVLTRDVLDVGVVLVTYDNNKGFLINYTEKDYESLYGTVKGKDFMIVEVVL